MGRKKPQKKTTPMNSPFDIYLAFLSAISDGMDPTIIPIDSTNKSLPPVSCFFYKGSPEPGFTTALTYGLSLASHRDWDDRKPELLICVRSNDEAWGLAVGFQAERLRGNCPFFYGDVVNHYQKISDESEMSAFFVFAPPILDPESTLVELPDRDIEVVGMYPIYEGEIDLIQQMGIDAFMKLEGFDPFDVCRPNLSRCR